MSGPHAETYGLQTIAILAPEWHGRTPVTIRTPDEWRAYFGCWWEPPGDAFWNASPPLIVPVASEYPERKSTPVEDLEEALRKLRRWRQ